MRQVVETFGTLWDIENQAYAFSRRNEGEIKTTDEKVAIVDQVARALPNYMSLWGFVPNPQWQLAFAKSDLPPCYVRTLKERGYSVGLTERRRRNAADGKFGRALWEVEKGFRPPLPNMMCIITGDRDFYDYLLQLRRFGCHVWVVNWCRERTSRFLVKGSKRRRGADRFISFPELLAEAPAM